MVARVTGVRFNLIGNPCFQRAMRVCGCDVDKNTLCEFYVRRSLGVTIHNRSGPIHFIDADIAR
jgi:hypothetical protein